MKDLTNAKWIKLKGLLFLFLGLGASVLLLVEQPTLKVALLLAVAVWCSCRAYYFAFYVIEHYVDPGFRFSGLYSFVGYLFSKRQRGNGSGHDLDWFALERLYDEGRELFLRGKHEEAIDRFKRVYEDTLDLRDVAKIVDDYYTLPHQQWVAKYQARFRK